MAVRVMREIGDEILRQQAKPVKRFDDWLHRLVDDMFETMVHYNGIGLAAPQIGVPKRVIVLDVDDTRIALVNPEIIAAEGEEVSAEGCLSVPGVIGDVTRSAKITLRGSTPSGESVEFMADGLLARCLQHEIDHLNGILFVDTAQNIEKVVENTEASA